jgi:cell division septation protein DedD
MGSSERNERASAVSHVIQLTVEDEHDFWAHVERADASGAKDCWMWLGTGDKDGYGVFRVGGKRIGAARIGWVLDHQQPLASYDQIRRTCSTKGCVRPSHSRRNKRAFRKHAESRHNPTYYVIRPPEGGRSEAPRQKTIDALVESREELRTLRQLLRTLLTTVPGNHTFLVESLTKTRRSIANLQAVIETNAAETDKRLTIIERQLVARAAESEPSHAPMVLAASEQRPTPEPPEPEPTPEPEPAPEPTPEPERAPEAALLMNAFKSELGGPGEPTDDDYSSLEMVFEIAMAEADGPGGAVQRFGTWLTSFRELTATHPEMERTPQDFAREVSAQRL